MSETNVSIADLPAEVAKALKQYTPQDDDELWDWISVQCGLQIPRKAVCEHHDAPFQFVADAFFNREPNQIIVAGRGTGKTISAAALSYVELHHMDGVEVASVGAILHQSKKLYRYIRDFADRDVELGLSYPPTMSETKLANKSRLEVLTGKTREAVNSPHPHRANIDEFELIDPDILEEAQMMLTETQEYVASLRLLSTRKFSGGNVQIKMDSAAEEGYKVYQFCALDVAEKCTYEERPTCEGCKGIVKYDSQRNPVSFYDICQERLRQAEGFYSINELISKFQKLTVEKFRTQVAPCSEPPRGDVCFEEWSDSVHAAEITPYDPDFPIGTGWDFGLHDPTVCVVFQWDDYGEAWIVDMIASQELGETADQQEWLVKDVVDAVLARPYGDAIKESRTHWGDPAGKQKRVYTRKKGLSAFKVLRRMGIKVRAKKKPNPARRIEAIKLKLRPNPETGEPSLFVSANLEKVKDAFRYAQWKEGEGWEEYQHDEYSHILDAIGYFVDAMWPSESWHESDQNKHRKRGRKSSLVQ